jgi:flagellar basal-body rod modification protein FlgD
MVDAVAATTYLTTDQYADQQMMANSGDDELGRDAFLTLLTTQLTNQNPLDPMDNEAFVAQLAQFSSVEGIKGMQASLEGIAAGMRQDQMMAGANLVGKTVSVEGGFVQGGSGQQSQGSVNLAYGADELIFSVYDPKTGDLVFRESGKVELNWNGTNNYGQAVANGEYLMAANIVRNGKLESAPVTTMAQVKSVRWDPQTQQLSLEVGNGSFISLAAVERIGV